MKTQEELYKFLRHMEDENNKSMLGGMAWDDIDWHIHDANSLGITDEQLVHDFLKLLRHIVK